MKNNIIELSNVEIKEYCLLNLETNKKIFSRNFTQEGFTGLYFKDDKTFFAIYPTLNGPVIYYKNKTYQITRDLNITLQKKDKQRTFTIKNYRIKIKYKESPYIGFDVWSTEMDVDLFYMIEQSYKQKTFYEKYTLKE